MLDIPASADWPVTGIAPLTTDSVNAALLVRGFDTTAPEGAGFILEIPQDMTNMTIDLRSRAHTAPSAVTNNVVPRVYARRVPDNAAVSAWSYVDMTAISFPTGVTTFQYDSQTIGLTTLGVTGGCVTQLEMTRNPADGSDDLVGDWDLLEIKTTLS
jgi:hypothetical protein